MNPPCFTCGFGTTCQYGGPAQWITPEEFENFTEITPDMFQRVEADTDMMKRLTETGQRLGEKAE